MLSQKPHKANYQYVELAAPGLESRTTTEIFYRVQLAQNLAITPGIQLLQDLALNDEHDQITIVGLRVRLTF